MKKLVCCADCPEVIDVERDPFCLVTPHGERIGSIIRIPLCKNCRAQGGYDILTNYTVLSENRHCKQPELPQLEYNPGDVVVEVLGILNAEETITESSEMEVENG